MKRCGTCKFKEKPRKRVDMSHINAKMYCKAHNRNRFRVICVDCKLWEPSTLTKDLKGNRSDNPRDTQHLRISNRRE